jgi:hypothetical protein
MDLSKFASRKFWIVIATALIVALNKELGFGLSEDAILSLVGVASAYLVGQGVADAGKELASKGATNAKK